MPTLRVLVIPEAQVREVRRHHHALAFSEMAAVIIALDRKCDRVGSGRGLHADVLHQPLASAPGWAP